VAVFLLARGSRTVSAIHPSNWYREFKFLGRHLVYWLFRPCPLPVDPLTNRKETAFVTGRVARCFLY
jgi:hypothetical protein